MKKVKKIIASALAVTAMVGIMPMCANAAWKHNSTGWWYTEGNSYVQNSWRRINGDWYYFNSNGYMKTGWLKDNNKWYYLNYDGTMKTGWLKYNNDWYYLNGGGDMALGWIKYNNSWYYLDEYNEGKMVYNKWMCMGYHLNSEGIYDKRANYLRNDIFKGTGIVKTASGTLLYEAGDPSPLNVINGEPCVFVMTKDEQFRDIGMNTLNVYGDNNQIVDKAVLN